MNNLYKLLYLHLLLMVLACSTSEDTEPEPDPNPEGPQPYDDDTTTVLGNWIVMDSAKNITGYEIAFLGKDTIFVNSASDYRGKQHIKYTYDGGLTWMPEGELFATFEANYNEFIRYGKWVVAYARYIPGEPNYRAFYFNCLNRDDWWCNDSGRHLFNAQWTWSLQDVYVINDYMIVLISNNRIITGDQPGKFKESSDFTFSTGGNNFMSIASLSDTSNLIVGSTKGVVWKTTDRGKTWREVLKDTKKLQIMDIQFFDDKIGFLTTNNNTGYRTTDGGENWQRVEFPYSSYIFEETYGMDKEIIMVSKDRWFAEHDKSVYETVDGGLTWQRSLKAGKWITALAYDGVGALVASTEMGLVKLML